MVPLEAFREQQAAAKRQERRHEQHAQRHDESAPRNTTTPTALERIPLVSAGRKKEDVLATSQLKTFFPVGTKNGP